MALVVEDGSIVANANSYQSLIDIRAYATARGVTLPVDDAEVEAMAFSAMDYLEGQRARYQGVKTDPANQELQWPRTGVSIDCYAIDSDVIPKELKNAENQLIIEINANVDILPTTEQGGFVIREKVDVIDTEYSELVGVGVNPRMTAVDALLEPLFFPCGQKFALTSIRV